jgi:hypothetical protein
MGTIKRRELSEEEQHVLDHGHLRLLERPEEIARCDQAIVEHPYLHNASLVGEHLRYAFISIKDDGWRSRPGVPPPSPSRIETSSSGGRMNSAGDGGLCWPTTRGCWSCPTAIIPT